MGGTATKENSKRHKGHSQSTRKCIADITTYFTHSPFDAQPKIMAEMIAANGGATSYMQTNCKKLTVEYSSESE